MQKNKLISSKASGGQVSTSRKKEFLQAIQQTLNVQERNERKKKIMTLEDK